MTSKPVLEGLPGLQKWPEEFKHLTVFCGGETFRLHKVVLCSNSEYFTKALCGGFGEADKSEIKLPEEDAETFKHLVQFCYSGTYVDRTTNLEQGNQNHGFGAHYLSPADISAKYQSLAGLLGAAGPSFKKVKTTRRRKRPGVQDEIKLAPSTPEVMSEFERPILIAGRVYIMAETLLMPGIKVLALERFRAGVEDLLTHHLSELSPTPALIRLIDHLYTNLLETEIAIKEPICRLIASKRLQSTFWDMVSPVMRKHGALATGVANYINLLIPLNVVTCEVLNSYPGVVRNFERSIAEKPTEEMCRKWMEKERQQCGWCA